MQFTRNVRSLNRLRQIAQVLTRHGFGHLVAQTNLTRFLPLWMLRKKTFAPPPQEGASAIGRRLAEVCAQLGPTFVKLGQLMSTRPDIVPADVLAELNTLQDDVPPFDTSEAMEIIAEQLGRPAGECFGSIDPMPFASASIGQVYSARSSDGAPLVVKVRRPGIEETIKLDMELLRWLAESIESFMPEFRVYRPAMIVDEFDQALTRELDYINEAATTDCFATLFRGDVGIRIPKVHWDLTGPRMLTLEALEGISIEKLIRNGDTAAESVNRPLVARRLADCYLKQVFELGRFHADPHPGNLLVHAPATVGLIDFGQVGTLSDDLLNNLVVMVYAWVNNEMEVVVDALADVGVLGRSTDRRHLHGSLQFLYDKYSALPIKRLDLATLFSEFSDLMRRNDVTVPRDLSMLIKALGTVGNVTARLDPELNLIELMKPRVRQAMSERFSPKEAARTATLLGWDLLSIVRQAPGQIRGALRRLSSHGWEFHIRHENLDRLIQELDRSSNRLAFSIVIAAIIVGSSVVLSAGSELQVLGVQVKYLGVLGYLIAGVLGLGLSWAIFRSGRLH